MFEPGLRQEVLKTAGVFHYVLRHHTTDSAFVVLFFCQNMKVKINVQKKNTQQLWCQTAARVWRQRRRRLWSDSSVAAVRRVCAKSYLRQRGGVWCQVLLCEPPASLSELSEGLTKRKKKQKQTKPHGGADSVHDVEATNYSSSVPHWPGWPFLMVTFCPNTLKYIWTKLVLISFPPCQSRPRLQGSVQSSEF